MNAFMLGTVHRGSAEKKSVRKNVVYIQLTALIIDVCALTVPNISNNFFLLGLLPQDTCIKCLCILSDPSIYFSNCCELVSIFLKSKLSS